MSSLNQCNFIGRLGRDPETRYLTNGDAVTNITLAVDESYKDKSGNKVDKCEWINVTFYRKLAEIVGQYLTKGSLIYVSGKMQTRKLTDKNGIERYKTEIIASDMKMLSSKQNANNKESDLTQQRSDNTDTGFDDMDDDIPF